MNKPSTYADYCEAYKIFERLGDYKDSREKLQQCSEYIYEFENNAKFEDNQLEEEKVNRKPKTVERNKIKLIVILLIMLDYYNLFNLYKSIKYGGKYNGNI